MSQPQDAIRFVKSENLPPSPGYSQAVEAKGGRIIYVAGQVAVDRSGKVVGEGDMRLQAQQTFENLKAALASVGATFDHVVKVNNYIVNIGANIALFREVRDKYVNTGAPPASTTIGVPELARPGALFEVEAVAILPAK